jgi:hypothetical protein
LEAVFINLREGLSDLGEHYGQSLRAKKKRITDAELNRLFANYVMATSVLLSMLTIRNVTLAVGAQELDLIYEDVRKELDLPSVGLLNLSTRLEYYRGHPAEQATQMHEAVKKKPFSSELIRQLVIVNMYLYYWPVRERQKVLSAFGLKKVENNPKFMLPKGKLLRRVENKRHISAK